MAEPGPRAVGPRSPVSRWLSRVDELASRPLTVLLVVGAGVAWIVVSLAAGFPPRWETVFETVVAAVTLSMVFVIQHTQARHQRAAQRKLDEILAAMPDADNSLLTLEHAADAEMHATGHQHGRIRQAALDDRGSADGERPEG